MIRMDEYTKVDTAGRSRKWILRGGAAGGLILVGSVLLASFSPISAMGSMGGRHEMGEGHAMGEMGSMGGRHAMGEMGSMGGRHEMGEGHAMGEMGSMGGRHEMGEGHAMGSMGEGHAMGARPVARMGAAQGGQVGEFLGMDRQELREAVRGGASIADLAGDRTDELVADLVTRATERIEQAVTDGRLNRERADGMLSRVEERITARLEGGHLAGPSGLSGS